MPRYMVERNFDRISEEEFGEAGKRSKRVAIERFPEVTWEHSHMVADAEGRILTYCVYEAPNEEVVRRHAEAFGGHVVNKIVEIVDDIDPANIQV